jgi:hypothetical protein
MPTPNPPIRLIYRKRAKDAKRAKGTTNPGASMAFLTERDAICATQSIPIGGRSEDRN